MEDFPKAPQSNPFNYSDDELEQRESFIKRNKTIHPHVPELWSQWMFDWIYKMTDEEREALMDEKK